MKYNVRKIKLHSFLFVHLFICLQLNCLLLLCERVGGGTHPFTYFINAPKFIVQVQKQVRFMAATPKLLRFRYSLFVYVIRLL